MSEANEDYSWLLKTVIAKSDQLNAVDLVAGPITVAIEQVRQTGNEKQPVAVYYTGCNGRPYKPCLQMRQVLLGCWGIQSWIGRLLTLYSDSRVTWSGEQVGGVRISNMSHLGCEKKEIQLNASKNKKITWTVFNIPTDDKPKAEPSMDERVAKAVKAIKFCDTMEKLDRTWNNCSTLYQACDDAMQKLLTAAKTEQEEVLENGN